MTIVVDASLVYAAFVELDERGIWAEQVLASDDLAAPHIMLAEVANTLRRASLAGNIDQAVAEKALEDILLLPIDLHPFEGHARRIWELRNTVSAYDAWYVALAEELGASLGTLDFRLVRAPGPRCDFRTFEP